MSSKIRENLAIEIAQLLKKSHATEDGGVDGSTERKLDEMIDKALKEWEG